MILRSGSQAREAAGQTMEARLPGLLTRGAPRTLEQAMQVSDLGKALPGQAVERK